MGEFVKVSLGFLPSVALTEPVELLAQEEAV